MTDGTSVRKKRLGTYREGSNYHIQISVDKAKAITIEVFGEDLLARDSITAADLPDLFGSVRISVTASAQATAGASRAALTGYKLTLPHQSFWANKVDDNRVRAALLALVVLGSLLVVSSLAAWRWGQIRSRDWYDSRHRLQLIATYARTHPVHVGILCLASIAYFVGNVLLVPLGGHPFDFGNEKLYAYVARVHGPADLYYLPNLVSLAGIWGGVPWSEAAFPYEPTIAYLDTLIGWLTSLLFASGGTFDMTNVSLEYVIKGFNIAFGFVDAVLLFLILRTLGTTRQFSLVASGLFLFNPAVWFSMSVWGQTHVISLCFALLSVLFAEKRLAPLGWIALAAACLTRPQMLVVGLLLGTVFLMKLPWRENVSAVSWAVVVVFLAISPLMLAISPSFPLDIMLKTFHVQQAGGNEAALMTVSQDAYSIWPLVTYLLNGASGGYRSFTPTSTEVIGSLTYQSLSQFLTLTSVLFVVALIVRRRGGLDAAYLPLVAVGVASFLMLLTGVVATHFLLALPFFLLCRRWMVGHAYYFVVAVWSITTFVPMFGDMGAVLSSQDYPALAPAGNAITRFFTGLYRWDRFITVAVVANMCAVAWLAFFAFRSRLTARVSDHILRA